MFMNHSRKILISWILFAVCLGAFGYMVSQFILFPKSRLPKLILYAVLIFAAATLIGHLLRNVKKGWVSSALYLLLSGALVLACCYIPSIEKRMMSVFMNDYQSEEVTVNAYVLTTEYKADHADIFKDTNHIITSSDLLDYRRSTFITTSSVDADLQNAFLKDIGEAMGTEDLPVLNRDNVIDSLMSFYAGEGEVLIMPDYYTESIETIPGFENFTKDTVVLQYYVYNMNVNGVISVNDGEDHAVTIFVAGNDSENDKLSYYGRTDVDLIVTYNVENRQILIVSLPRDFYVQNPYFADQLDKLTHLGNNGLDNTVKELNRLFDIQIPYYVTVSIKSFQRIIDALGGIGVDNPYEFTFENEWNHIVYEEGRIHLDGKSAMLYVRVRKTLENGDFDRNEHQNIVMKGIIEKAMSDEIITHYSDVLDALQSQFITNMPAEDIYALAANVLDTKDEWSFVMYHLGGTAQFNTTASMGDMMLYTVIPFDSQLEFISEQIRNMHDNKVIEQQELPNADDTTFIEN